MLYNPPELGHDTAINPLIVWLFFICILLLFLQIKKWNVKKFFQSYSLAAAVSFLLFCSIVKWEPFVTRYMISYLALLCPMICRQLQKGAEAVNVKALDSAFVGIIVFLCIVDIGNLYLYHRNIATTGGTDCYFANRGDEYVTYVAICNSIRNHDYCEVGLLLGGDHYEYPFWAMLGEAVDRWEHVCVENESSCYADPEFHPQCIVAVGSDRENLTWNGMEYTVLETYNGYCLMVPLNE